MMNKQTRDKINWLLIKKYFNCLLNINPLKEKYSSSEKVIFSQQNIKHHYQELVFVFGIYCNILAFTIIKEKT